MPKILVLNGHCSGEYCRVSSIPQVGSTVVARDRKAIEDGGKGTNASIAIGRMGGSVGFIGKCGDDEGGHLGQKWMGDAGVDLTHYTLSKDIKTIVSLVVVADNGDNIIINFMDEKNFITPQEVSQAIEKSTDAQYFIGGFEIPWKTVLHGCQEAKKKGMMTVLNPSPLEEDVKLENLNYVDIFVVNETETEVLLKEKFSDEASWWLAAQKLKEKFGCKNVVITLGEKGSIALTQEGQIKVPSRPTKAIDTVGAGDGYLAILVWRLSVGDDFKEAMQFASNYSSYVCSHTGTVMVYPTPEQLKTFLEQK